MTDLNPEALEAARRAVRERGWTTAVADDAVEAGVRAYLAADKGATEPRLEGITSAGLDLYEQRMDGLGIPREEYAAQAGGVVRYTFWGRIDEALERLPADKGMEEA